MLITLDVVTRKKLILVKQIYQRALIQSQNTHSFVDRIFAIVGFDLANETLLKVVVSALNPKKNITDNFQGVLSQAEEELNPKNITITDKVKIQHVRNLRNDAQHKAKYPNENDASDCRTYTRDFLTQIFFDVWGESFNSINLIDVVQNVKVKNLLSEAEQDLIKCDYLQTVIKSLVAFEIMSEGLATLITESVSDFIKGIVVSDTFGNKEVNKDLFTAFMRMREATALQVTGINLQDYLRYKCFTQCVAIAVMSDYSYHFNLLKDAPNKNEAEYVFDFVTNAVIQIENLDKDVKKAYNSFS